MVDFDSVTGLFSGLADYGFIIQRLLSGSDRPRLYSHGWDDNKLNALEVFWMNLLSRLEKGLPPEELEGLLSLKFAETDFEVNRFPKKKQGSIANSSGSSIGSSVGSKSGGNSVLCGVCRESRSDQKGKNVDINVQMREAFAQSPLSSHLQPGAEQLQVLFVCGNKISVPWEKRTNTVSRTNPSRIVVILPSTGEQSYTDRIAVAKALISREEYTICLIVMSPYYAERKPTTGPIQRSFYARTVGDYQTQVAAISMEGAALLKWANKEYPNAKLCVTGFSWGAGMSCGSAILASNALPRGVCEKRLALVPYVGCASPVPYITGIYSIDIDFYALEKEKGGGRKRLMEIFTRSTWKALIDSMKKSRSRNFFGSLVSVTMIHDKFVPYVDQRELHDLMGECTVNNVENRRIITFGGGHAVAGLSTTTRQVDAVDTAFNMLERAADEEED